MKSPPTPQSPTTGVSQVFKGPQRYRKQTNSSTTDVGQDGVLPEPKDHTQFVEERFGRNLDIKLAANAKLAVRRRIAGALTADTESSDKAKAGQAVEASIDGRGVDGSLIDDVYLYPTGMSSIFNTHRSMMKCRGKLQSICFGFELSSAVVERML